MLSSLKRPHLEYFKEFYADTAMFGGTYGLPCGLEFFGGDKVVFASDAPLAGIPMHIKAIDGLNLDAATYKKIMHGNAEKLLEHENQLNFRHAPIAGQHWRFQRSALFGAARFAAVGCSVAARARGVAVQADLRAARLRR